MEQTLMLGKKFGPALSGVMVAGRVWLVGPWGVRGAG